MIEAELRRYLAANATRAVPDDSRLSIDVVSLAVSSRPAVHARRGLRFRLAVVAAIAVASLSAAGAAAVASGTLPVEFDLIQAGRHDDKEPVGSDGAKQKAAAFDVKAQAAADKAKGDKLASEGRTPTEDWGLKPSGGTLDTGRDDVAMSLDQAQTAFGAHVLVAPELTPDGVFFLDVAAMQAAKPGARLKNEVTLKYSLDGTVAQVTETREDSTTPLTVEALDQNGPTLKADGGLGRAAIETAAGGSYVVGYSVDGSRVVTVMFKASSGVVVTIRFQEPIGHDEALAFATSLE